MRIVVFSQFYHPIKFGGAEVSTQLLAEGLAAKGWDVRVATSLLGDEPLDEVIAGVKVRRFKTPNIYEWNPKKQQSSSVRLAWHFMDAWNPVSFFVFRSYLAETNPDIVHTNTIAGFSCSVWAAAASLNIPVVHTLRDFYLLCPRSTMFRNGGNCTTQCVQCRVLSEPKRLQSHSVSAVVGISNFVLQRHFSHGFFSRASRHVIYNSCGVAPGLEQRTYRVSSPLRIGYLGRIHTTKGVEWLLNFIRPFLSADVSLAVAGDGDKDYIQKLKDRFADVPAAFVGPRRTSSFLREIDLLIVPSLWNEPLGRVVLEAYACGIPVAVSNRGGLPELVHGYGTGCVFDPDTPESLEVFLKEIIGDRSKLQRLSTRALEQSHAFREEPTLSQYMDAFQALLSTHV